jgi:hypothetical protein
MAQTASGKPGRAPLWPVGTQFISLQNMTDVDAEENPRLTPAGSLWRVVERDPKKGLWHLVCDQTGAWIGVKKKKIIDDFDFHKKSTD